MDWTSYFLLGLWAFLILNLVWLITRTKFPKQVILGLHNLGIIKGVALMDFEGKVSYSRKFKRIKLGFLNEHEWYSYVYPFTKIGNVTLKEDHSCEGDASYIKYWVDLK